MGEVKEWKIDEQIKKFKKKKKKGQGGKRAGKRISGN
jgi:hypothetical protein